MKFIRAGSRDDSFDDDPLREYSVWWDDLSYDDVAVFKERLEQATREQDLQELFEARPILLAQLLGGGHGRWVLPRKRFGAEFVPDFVVGERSSEGFRWQLIELENPRARMFTKGGDPTHQLTHAIRQVKTWRAWLVHNQNYAARLRSDNGLGLTDISPNSSALIIIGRRRATSADTNSLRRQMTADDGIEIHSYDYLLEAAEGRVAWTVDQKARTQQHSPRSSRAHPARRG